MIYLGLSNNDPNRSGSHLTAHAAVDLLGFAHHFGGKTWIILLIIPMKKHT